MAQRVLWCSPVPPEKSGVADYAVELLPDLARRLELRVLVPPGHPPEELAQSLPGIPLVAAGEDAQPDELPLYHLGNNPHHIWIYRRLRRHPGVVVLHDVVLHHLVVEATLARQDQAGFAAEMQAAYGAAGRALADGRSFGITGPLDPFLFPATSSGLVRAVGAVLHSRWAEAMVAAAAPELPRAMVPLPVADPGTVQGGALRQELGIPQDAMVVMHLGFLTEQKGVEIILGAVAAGLRCGLPLHLVLVGEGDHQGLITEAASRLDLRGRVHATGWLDEDSMRRAPAAADLGVVLRNPSAGETSAAVLRFLACGTPVAVTAQHQFLEWPMEAVFRVSPGAAALAELVRVLDLAYEERQSRAAVERRRAARDHFLAHHQPSSTADALAEFLGNLDRTKAH